MEQATSFLRERIARPPSVVLVLGSGMGPIGEEVVSPVRVPYGRIPGFPRSTVRGHEGALLFGRLEGVEVAVMAGRFHLYEGWLPSQVVAPIRALAALGADLLLLTNAAGGIRRGMVPGDLLLIADHINLSGRNPLTGPAERGEERFPDMSSPYDADVRRTVSELASECGIPLEQGVYAALLGPSYETPAEIRMLRRLGADAVGMSTVPEVIAGRALGLRVAGISCITNVAAGLAPGVLSHDEVLQVGTAARERLATLVKRVLPRVATAQEATRPPLSSLDRDGQPAS